MVELAYGVAPDHRGRGYAIGRGAAGRPLAAAGGLAREVELRIDPGHVASQRVAAAAGFVPAGTVTSRVPGDRGKLHRSPLRHARDLAGVSGQPRQGFMPC